MTMQVQLKVRTLQHFPKITKHEHFCNQHIQHRFRWYVQLHRAIFFISDNFIMRKMKSYFFPSLLQNVMSNLIDSPLIQARQILSMSPTSPTNLTVSQVSSSSLDQMIMPIHQISQNQKPAILPDAGMFRCEF